MRCLLSILIVCFTPGVLNAQISRYAENVLIHVIVHEMGHALIREFDLPLLGNEEVIADDFATLFIAHTLPDRAGEIIADRFDGLIAEGDDESIFSEHDDDDRRAGRAVCLLYGVAPDRHEALAREKGMTADEAAGCRDSAPEIARGWRRALAPLLMPPDAAVTEVRIHIDDGPWQAALADSDLEPVLRDLLAAFDWHSLVTLSFETCDSGAAWFRNGRTIRICSDDLARFEAQNARSSN